MNTQKVQKEKEVKSNGVNQSPKLLPLAQAVKPTEESKETAEFANIQKFASKLPPTAEERIKRIEQFKALSERYNVLKEKDNDLKLFIAGNDKMTARISLENQAGFKMEIRNSNVIEKVLKTMQDELNILLADSENEVLNFEI
ncbi:hypothetical protein [Flavobacterium nitratireducens]|uniref:hypothetical protein n=1 Tax=Flavobacterium nitratireducens TaxID=992289 RepID=UPI002415949E|nr:hypothetical protein [Flavobacterium nitratireducens]